MTGPVDRLLPIKRKVIAVLADEDLRQQSGCRETALLETRWQRRDHWRGVRITPAHGLQRISRRRRNRPGSKSSRSVTSSPIKRQSSGAFCTGSGTMTSSITGRSAGHRSRPWDSRLTLTFVLRVSLLQGGSVDFSRFVLRGEQKQIKLVARPASRSSDQTPAG